MRTLAARQRGGIASMMLEHRPDPLRVFLTRTL